MPQLVGENIASGKALQFRAWMKLPAVVTLREVVGAKQRLAEEEALEQARKSVAQDDCYTKLSTAGLKNARRYAIFLEVFEELGNPDTPLQTIKLKP